MQCIFATLLAIHTQEAQACSQKVCHCQSWFLHSWSAIFPGHGSWHRQRLIIDTSACTTISEKDMLWWAWLKHNFLANFYEQMLTRRRCMQAITKLSKMHPGWFVQGSIFGAMLVKQWSQIDQKIVVVLAFGHKFALFWPTYNNATETCSSSSLVRK